MAGGKVGNYRGDIKKIVEDINILKPTFFPCVPRLLNRLYDLINEGIAKLDAPVQEMFHKAYKTKFDIYKKTGEFYHPEIDASPLFTGFRAKIGGNVKVILTAAAPLSPEVFDFFRVVLSVDFREAYGQTESSGASFAN